MKILSLLVILSLFACRASEEETEVDQPSFELTNSDLGVPWDERLPALTECKESSDYSTYSIYSIFKNGDTPGYTNETKYGKTVTGQPCVVNFIAYLSYSDGPGNPNRTASIGSVLRVGLCSKHESQQDCEARIKQERPIATASSSSGPKIFNYKLCNNGQVTFFEPQDSTGVKWSAIVGTHYVNNVAQYLDWVGIYQKRDDKWSVDFCRFDAK